MGHLIIILIIAGLVYYVAVAYPSKIKYKMFEQRECLSPEEFYEKFYSESKIRKQVLFDILQFMEKNLDLPISKLRPNDRFDKELAVIIELEVVDDDISYFWDATFNRLYESAEKKQIDLKKALYSIKNIDEYIKTFASIYE